MGEILVLVEHREGELREITFEMLVLASRLGKEERFQVSALLLGDQLGGLSRKLMSACDRVLTMDCPDLGHYNAEYYSSVLEDVIRKREPFVTLLGHTSTGMDVAPALATRLSLPLVTDCLEATLQDGKLKVLRQVYGGKVNESLDLKPRQGYILSVRPGSFPAQRDQGKTAEVEEMDAPAWEHLRGRRFLRLLEAELEDVDIGDAEILVSVGRGIGKEENIAVAQDFADSIGATLSCSRPVADKGWLPKSRQVGTSGKTVRPKVYIALGISGAFQHQAGMKNSGTIIAVNKDPKAPIFAVAHYGIVADLFQVLPVLKGKLQRT